VCLLSIVGVLPIPLFYGLIGLVAALGFKAFWPKA
jgi:hypothetical protein